MHHTCGKLAHQNSGMVLPLDYIISTEESLTKRKPQCLILYKTKYKSSQKCQMIIILVQQVFVLIFFHKHILYEKIIARAMLFHPLVWPITINSQTNRRESVLEFINQTSNGQFESLLSGATKL